MFRHSSSKVPRMPCRSKGWATSADSRELDFAHVGRIAKSHLLLLSCACRGMGVGLVMELFSTPVPMDPDRLEE